MVLALGLSACARRCTPDDAQATTVTGLIREVSDTYFLRVTAEVPAGTRVERQISSSSHSLVTELDEERSVRVALDLRDAKLASEERCFDDPPASRLELWDGYQVACRDKIRRFIDVARHDVGDRRPWPPPDPASKPEPPPELSVLQCEASYVDRTFEQVWNTCASLRVEVERPRSFAPEVRERFSLWTHDRAAELALEIDLPRHFRSQLNERRVFEKMRENGSAAEREKLPEILFHRGGTYLGVLVDPDKFQKGYERIRPTRRGFITIVAPGEESDPTSHIDGNTFADPCATKISSSSVIEHERRGDDTGVQVWCEYTDFLDFRRTKVVRYVKVEDHLVRCMVMVPGPPGPWVAELMHVCASLRVAEIKR
ncbi:MAG: hypothetical protein KIT31_37055 [Deltaproteobacteria bacterium]|nr:hypothetical protein [Deltaproteobacteria bacterium]